MQLLEVESKKLDLMVKPITGRQLLSTLFAPFFYSNPMAKVPYIPLYIGDWEQDTNCLSLQAEAAWLKIIFKMFKNDKNGIYKTSTKSLQNLWKTSTNGVQEILSELVENEICGLDIGEQIIFTNRRMLREAEISEKRTKAVQNRYKPSTKKLQNTDIDNDIDIESEIVKKDRGAGKGKTELTESEVRQTIQFCHLTHQRKYEPTRIRELWEGFTIATQGEFYLSHAKQLSHFRNWIKNQPYETAKRNAPADQARLGSTRNAL